MKKTILVLLIASPTISMASDHFYVGVEGGWSASKVTKEGLFRHSYVNKNIGVGTLKGGYAFDNGLRTELALTQYGNMKHSEEGIEGTVKSRSIMGNLYYDIPLATNLSVYAMTGLGIAFNKLSVNYQGLSNSKSKTGLAWQMGGGVSYAFTDNLIGDFGVKYVYRNSLNNDLEVDLVSYDTTIGIRYMF